LFFKTNQLTKKMTTKAYNIYRYKLLIFQWNIITPTTTTFYKKIKCLDIRS